jgi:hypothetical protein
MLSFIAIFLLVASSLSCKKKGCTDPTSLNYNSAAEKDDESCTPLTQEELIVGKWKKTHEEAVVNGTSAGLVEYTGTYSLEITSANYSVSDNGSSNSTGYEWSGNSTYSFSLNSGVNYKVVHAVDWSTFIMSDYTTSDTIVKNHFTRI